MNCPNCGGTVNEGMNNCPYCGTTLNNNNNVNQQMPGQESNNVNNAQNVYPSAVGGVPLIQNRSIITAILLSLVTCGIYGIYWFICMTDESNNLVVQNKAASGGTAFLYTILTCGIYTLYWNYKMGKKMHEAGVRYGRQVDDNSVLYLILSILGLGIVNYIMIQNDLNKFASQ